MGVKLMVEVMDHSPETLTPRERYVLVVLAENARDSTRVCLPGIEDDEAFIRRSRLASRSQRYAVIQALISKKVLERVRRGQKGVRAEYRIAGLTDAQGPGNQDAESAEEVVVQGPGNTDAEPSQGPENRDAENRGVGVQGPGNTSSGSRISTVRVPETGTPSPHTPQPPQENVERSSSTPKKRQRSPRKAEPYREDVERICVYLADKVEANGSKRPTITHEWRREARLLLDEKRPIPVTVDRVINAIDWATADHFWHRNVLSMPTLRKQWERLRLARKAEMEGKPQRNGQASNSPRPIPATERCEKHPSYRRDRCGPCRSERGARPADANNTGRST